MFLFDLKFPSVMKICISHARIQMTLVFPYSQLAGFQCVSAMRGEGEGGTEGSSVFSIDCSIGCSIVLIVRLF